jgi:hypothetical protein
MNFFQPAQATEWRPKVAHGETVGFDSKMNKAPAGAKEKIRGFFFCRPCRGLFCFVVLPTVSPWATFGRALAALVLFLAVGATAQTTNTLSDAEIQGRKLAEQILEERPATNFTQTGVLRIQNANKQRKEISVTIESFPSNMIWSVTYQANRSGTFELWTVRHSANQPNRYFYGNYQNPDPLIPLHEFMVAEAVTNLFADSDFSLADLGLEFFHWPEQKILKKEFRRNCACEVLESTNPQPATNGYSRVVSWIDEESGGIVHAEAFDAQNKLLKVFDPKSFKKVNGQWQLQEMEIRNVQTGSRTRLEFDLNKQ